MNIRNTLNTRSLIAFAAHIFSKTLAKGVVKQLTRRLNASFSSLFSSTIPAREILPGTNRALLITQIKFSRYKDFVAWL